MALGKSAPGARRAVSWIRAPEDRRSGPPCRHEEQHFIHVAWKIFASAHRLWITTRANFLLFPSQSLQDCLLWGN